MIEYDLQQRSVRQEVDTIYKGDFEGKFDEILQMLHDKYNYLVHAYSIPRKLSDTYADGYGTKSVAFTDFSIVIRDDGEGDSTFYIMGHRDMLPEELESKQEEENENNRRRMQYNKAEYERLRKLFGDNQKGLPYGN